MRPSSKELKNIPVSISILHEQEYKNLCLILRVKNNKVSRRRAFSERSNDNDEIIQIRSFMNRRKTLKN